MLFAAPRTSNASTALFCCHTSVSLQTTISVRYVRPGTLEGVGRGILITITSQDNSVTGFAPRVTPSSEPTSVRATYSPRILPDTNTTAQTGGA